MKETKTSFVANESTPEYDFSDIKDRFDSLGFKAKASKNKLTIEFDDENQISDFLEYISK